VYVIVIALVIFSGTFLNEINRVTSMPVLIVDTTKNSMVPRMMAQTVVFPL